MTSERNQYPVAEEGVGAYVQSMNKAQLPIWLDKERLHKMASQFEEETIEKEKFQYLLSRDVRNLIQIGDVTTPKAKETKNKKKIKNLLYNRALLTLDDKNFIEDIVKFARTHNLATIRYSLDVASIFSRPQQVILGAWEFRLQYFSIINFSKKLKTSNKDLAQIFVDSFLPPKFEKKLRALMDKYGLEFFWYESILLLLLTGIWYLPRNTSVIHLNLELDESHYKGGEASVSLELSSLTTLEEIRGRWNEIEALQKLVFPSMKERNKPKKLEDVYVAKFKGDILGLADEGRRNNKSKEEYVRNQRAINRKLSRSKQEHNDFLMQYKKIPSKVLNQIEQTQNWSLNSVYYF